MQLNPPNVNRKSGRYRDIEVLDIEADSDNCFKPPPISIREQRMSGKNDTKEKNSKDSTKNYQNVY